MTISLGGVVLNDDLIWENQDTQPRNAFSRRVTIAGRVVLQHSPVDGREIILMTTDVPNGTMGYFTRAHLDSIRSFENNMSVVSFVYGSETLNVIVEPGGIEMEAVVPNPNPPADAWYLGQIKLIEKGL